jgi:hypothetical protein
MEDKTPTFQEVQSFFNAEYAFIKKWLAIKEPNWDEVIAESRELERAHPFRYCLDRIVSSVELIEKSYMNHQSAESNQPNQPERKDNNVKD